MLILNLQMDSSSLNRARTRLDRRLRYWKRELPYRTAVLYIAAVQKAITTQNFPQTYPAHSKSYKKHNNLFWVKTGDLLEEVMTAPLTTMVNTNDYTSMGFRFSQKALDTIKFMEHGTVNMPARPLFGPLYSRMSDEFLRLTGWALTDLQKTFKG